MSSEGSSAAVVRVDEDRFRDLVDTIDADFDRAGMEHDMKMNRIGDIALAVGIKSGLPDEELTIDEDYPFNLPGLDPDGFMEPLIQDEIADQDISYRDAVEQLLRQGLRTLHEDHDDLGGDDTPFKYASYLPDEVIEEQEPSDSA